MKLTGVPTGTAYATSKASAIKPQKESNMTIIITFVLITYSFVIAETLTTTHELIELTPSRLPRS